MTNIRNLGRPGNSQPDTNPSILLTSRRFEGSRQARCGHLGKHGLH